MRISNAPLHAALIVVMTAGAALTQTGGGGVATLRGAPLDQNAEAPAMRPQVNTDIRQVRNYPEQPPVIPHAIEGYQVDINANRCLTCHARTRIGDSQAPMVSVTHYVDREGQALAQVSPRRYFCTQCHVPQHPDEPGVENVFIDIDTLLSQEFEGAGD
ncbi:nitrate reductase cytochrome c-type subunit [Histidinibacterium aquaticum]|nr:nitrate reductase cytochrome c-type subunit [Histidinibacterium aquaticum]